MRNSHDKSNDKDAILNRDSFPHRAGVPFDGRRAKRAAPHDRRRVGLAALALAILLPTLAASAGAQLGTGSGDRDFHNFWGRQYSPQVLARSAHKRPSGLTTVLRWNQIAIDASGLDHTPVAAGETRIFGEQLGPCRASRAIAIAQIAVFEALNAIAGEYRTFTGMYVAPKKT